jgi:hypothetical protein
MLLQSGKTPLQTAAAALREHTGVVGLLLRAGAAVDATDMVRSGMLLGRNKRQVGVHLWATGQGRQTQYSGGLRSASGLCA